MKVIIKNARLSFHDLFEPKSMDGGKPKFNATLICGDDTTAKFTNSKGDVKVVPHGKLLAVYEHLLNEKFGKIPAKSENWFYNKADGSTHRDAFVNDDGDYWAGTDENTFYVSSNKIASKCKNGKMTVLDQRRDDIEANSGLLFSGCYVNAVIDVYAYQNDSGKGVTAELSGIQLLRTGEALGTAQTDARDEFEDEEIEAEDAFTSSDTDTDTGDLM